LIYEYLDKKFMGELDKLEFLIGSWKGSAKDQFGEKGTLESILECSHEPSEKFIQLRGESRIDGKLLNRGVEFVTFDSKVKRYIYKRIWSYGFIENGQGDWQGDTLVFEITFDNAPEFFAGTQWKSFIRRYGENEIGTGLLTSKEGTNYQLYGESRLSRVSP
jgi:hypothetical protein